MRRSFPVQTSIQWLFVLSFSLMSVLLTGCFNRRVASKWKSPIEKGSYTVQKAHSHNDYEQQHFFSLAYGAGFGSMEADIFLVDGQLLVAHSKKELQKSNTLSAMYLKPLAAKLSHHQGYPYKNHQYQLELLIDLKDPKDSPAYKKAVQLIYSYKSLVSSKHLRFTFTGNIPSDTLIAKATGPIYFDGVPGKNYSAAAWTRIYMLSDNFEKYTSWKGSGTIPSDDYQHLQTVIVQAHQQGKKVRFWNAPDNPKAWQLMKSLGVDYINTDRILALRKFLEK